MGGNMHRNEASLVFIEDQVKEIPMEARIARIESDVSYIKENIGNIHLDVRDLRGDMKAANESIAELKTAVVGLNGSVDAKINALSGSVDAKFNGLSGAIATLDAKVDAKLNEVRGSISTLDAKVDAKINGLSGAISTLDAKVDAKINGLSGAISTLDAKVDAKINGLSGAISTLDAKVDARNNALETKIIKWIIGTVLASATLAFSIAKFVN